MAPGRPPAFALAVLAALRSVCGRWSLAGLGHCTDPLEIWQNHDLPGCLRSCEASGSKCRYVSFLDDLLLRSDETPKPEVSAGTLSGGTLCFHYAHCGVLKSTLSGAATFHRHGGDGQGRSWPQADELVTISLGRSMSSRNTWQLRKQLCVDRSGPKSLTPMLKDRCADFWTLNFVAGPFMAKHFVDSVAVVKVTIQHGNAYLCTTPLGESPRSFWLDEGCENTWDVVRAGENQETIDSEACVWLRVSHDGNFTEGQYLSVSEDGSGLRFLPWSQDMSASCWTVGYEQSWMHQNFMGREDFEIAMNTAAPVPRCAAPALRQEPWPSRPRPRRGVPHVWLMASPKYNDTMQHLLSTFRRAGEAVRISVRWVPDFKNTTREGFHLTGQGPHARAVYAFNYLKLLFLFEAYLEAVESEDDMVVVMDLDVQVRRGWTWTLSKCMETAEICFLQQAAFGDRWQQANSGVLVFRPTSATGAFFHALTARLQGQEVLVRLLPFLDPVAFEQLLLNYILQQTRSLLNFTESQGHLHTVRWGVYSPLVAYAGMFLTSAVLTDTVHHATASNAHLRNKLRLMDAAELFVQDLRYFCPLDPSGCLEVVGPMLEFCYYFIGVDPHFGPLLEHYRVHRGFSERDNAEVVLAHLEERSGGRKTWISSVISFNEGGYKFYKQRRRNSSEALGELLLNPRY